MLDSTVKKRIDDSDSRRSLSMSVLRSLLWTTDQTYLARRKNFDDMLAQHRNAHHTVESRWCFAIYQSTVQYPEYYAYLIFADVVAGWLEDESRDRCSEIVPLARPLVAVEESSTSLIWPKVQSKSTWEDDRGGAEDWGFEDELREAVFGGSVSTTREDAGSRHDWYRIRLLLDSMMFNPKSCVAVWEISSSELELCWYESWLLGDI